jgi:hypothetical protein
MKTIAASLLLLLAVGCASTSMNATNETGGASAPAGITTNAKNAPEYVLLTAPNQIRTYDFGDIGVRGLHVRGTMTNRGFYPAGEIQGSGKFCAEGKDWLSLSDLKVHGAAEGKAPVAPYIVGCSTSAGFQPASRAVVAQ